MILIAYSLGVQPNERVSTAMLAATVCATLWGHYSTYSSNLAMSGLDACLIEELAESRRDADDDATKQ